MVASIYIAKGINKYHNKWRSETITKTKKIPCNICMNKVQCMHTRKLKM